MQIKKLPKSQLEIVSAIAWDDWKKYIDRAVEKLGKEIKVAGFRPGKAPKNMIEERIGRYAILEEAAGMAIRKDYPKIVENEKLDVIGQPKAELLKLAENNELEYKITTAVMPEVKIEDYENDISKINKDQKELKAEVEDSEINRELEQLANSRVKLITVRREAEFGDSVVLDFQVSRDGEIVKNGISKNHPLILGKGVFIPGFEENIIGMKENEEKKFTLTFPKEYYDKDLAGKPADFKIKVNLVQERQVPKIDDEFARSLGKFDNLDSLKKSITEGIKAEKERDLKEKRRTEIMDKILSKTSFDIPEILVHGELRKMIQEFSFQIKSMGMKLEDYLSKMGKSVADLEKDWEPQASKRIKSALVLEKIAKDREFEIPNEKIEEEMNKTLQYYKNVKDLEKNIEIDKLYNYTKSVLINEEVFKWLESL